MFTYINRKMQTKRSCTMEDFSISEWTKDVAGLFMAYGTCEKKGPKLKCVKTGEPKTWDINQGILVVYDEKGLPWVRFATSQSHSWLERVAMSHNLEKGAYVPHSNDNGKFLLDYMEKTGIRIAI